MLSTDRDILLDISGKIVHLNTELQAQRSELQALRAEHAALHEEQRVLTAKIDGLQHSLYWGLSIIGIIIAVFALWLSTPIQPILIQLPQSVYDPAKKSA